MKLAVVCDYSLRYTGGAQTALMAQVRAWSQQFPVVLIAPDAPRTHLPDVTVVRPPRGVRSLELPVVRANPVVHAWMRRTLKQHRAQAVMVHSEFGLAASAVAQAKQLGLPSLHTVHTFFWRAPLIAQPFAPVARVFHGLVTGLEQPRVRLAGRPLDSALRGMTLALARQADAVISPSAHQGERLRSAGLDNVSVVSNVAEVVPGERSLVPGTPLKLLWVGRFAPEKRLDVAIGAVRLARRRGAHVELTVAGGETPRGVNEPFIHFCGVVPHERVVDLIDDAHATLLTSCGFDNQPMVILESAARGRPTLVCDPVLATEFGGAVVGSAGNTATDLADTIVACAQAPETIVRAGREVKLLAQESSPRAHVKNLQNVISLINMS